MTIHRTVIVRTILRWFALAIYRLSGWRTEGKPPEERRYVVVAAPHTSNWDFFFTICLALIFRIDIRIMVKDAWFRGPLRPIFRWLGGLPIDRHRASGIVAQSIEQFARHEQLVMVISPAGTRRRVMYWKTGFYHIAHGAGVPIALGYLDYRRKVGGFGPCFHTTGDLDADMSAIREFYRPVTGKKPVQSCHSPVDEKTDDPTPCERIN